MTLKRETNSESFNFRLRPHEMEQLRKAVQELGYFSIATFVRKGIIEKIKRELKNE
jgi:hypothetical protein